MPDYKQMYITLFNRITDVIAELQTVQQEMEELYLQRPDAKITLLSSRTTDQEK
ncbi:MAG: hypothetical protein E6X17_02510 [Sporomusaceae bacterium]|nr:hypothetical protein [Sporomusaceae bacterium]